MRFLARLFLSLLLGLVLVLRFVFRALDNLGRVIVLRAILGR